MSANLRYGLAFHEQLVQPVPRARALSLVRWFRELVRRSLGEPNARVVVAGGFRRGKPQGHDIDILLTHPTPGMSPSLKWTLIFSSLSHTYCTHTRMYFMHPYKSEHLLIVICEPALYLHTLISSKRIMTEYVAIDGNTVVWLIT